MTERIEYTWNLDGFVDEQRYYRELSTIDINNPPTPKSVLSNSARTYIDTSVVVGQTYYVRFSSVKNGVEKFSNEITVTAAKDVDWAHVSALLHFNGSLYDEKNEVMWSCASPLFSTGKWGVCASFNANNLNTIKSPNFESINFGSSDFRIQMQLKLNRKSGSNEWMGVFGKQDEDSTRSYALVVNNNSSQLVFVFKSASTGTEHVLNSSVELPLHDFIYVEISRTDNDVYMIFEDEVVGHMTLPAGTSAYQNSYGLSLGRIYYNSTSFPLDGCIDEFRVVKGEGVDINNLSIPTSEFKNS